MGQAVLKHLVKLQKMLGAVNVQIPTHIALVLKQCPNIEIGGRPFLAECTILQIPIHPVYHVKMHHDSNCKHDAVKNI